MKSPAGNTGYVLARIDISDVISQYGGYDTTPQNEPQPLIVAYKIKLIEFRTMLSPNTVLQNSTSSIFFTPPLASVIIQHEVLLVNWSQEKQRKAISWETHASLSAPLLIHGSFIDCVNSCVPPVIDSMSLYWCGVQIWGSADKTLR